LIHSGRSISFEEPLRKCLVCFLSCIRLAAGTHFLVPLSCLLVASSPIACRSGWPREFTFGSATSALCYCHHCALQCAYMMANTVLLALGRQTCKTSPTQARSFFLCTRRCFASTPSRKAVSPAPDSPEVKSARGYCSNLVRYVFGFSVGVNSRLCSTQLLL
jgi:hypothetical protein